MVIGKRWLDDSVYDPLVDSINFMGTTRLFTQHMINAIVPKFNLISDDYNWKVPPLTDSTRKITEYCITDTTKIIHWLKATT